MLFGEDWLDLKRLRLFLEIADAGSFSRASTLLGLSQSALSRYIRTLEQKMGTRVFYRHGRGIQLTEAGKILQLRGKLIISEVSDTESEIASLLNGTTQKVVLAIQPGVSSLLTVPIARRAISVLGNARLHIMEGMSGHIFEWLAAGTIDLALHYDQPNLTRVHTEPVLSQKFLLVGPTAANLTLSKPIPAAYLTEVPLILPGRPHGLRVTLDTFAARKRLSLKIVIEVDSAPTIVRLVKQGIGYSVLPLELVSDDLCAGNISAAWISQPCISRTLLMTSATHKPFTQETRRLMQIIRQESEQISLRSNPFSEQIEYKHNKDTFNSTA